MLTPVHQFWSLSDLCYIILVLHTGVFARSHKDYNYYKHKQCYQLFKEQDLKEGIVSVSGVGLHALLHVS